MTLFNVITFIGGLAMLLFGIQFLIDNLCRLTGGKFGSIVGEMTSSPLKGVFWGVGLTALIQSSSVMTVSVVGLTNAGMIRLRQAVTLIMGANIGTTLTAWLFALTGVEGGNVLFQLLKAQNLSPFLAIAGVLVLLLAKTDRMKRVANVLLGLAIMFFGMMLMTGMTSLLTENGAFSGFMHRFSHPLIYFAVGFLLTAFMQSSVTSIAFLQAVAVSGVMHMSLAIPAIMGLEVGACVMALISAHGTSFEAKQAAVAHLLFNFFGTVLFFVFYVFLYFALGPLFFSQPISMVGIAAVHSIFNLVTAAVLLPILPYFEYWVTRLVPVGKNESSEAIILEKRFLSSPSFAAQYSQSAMMEIMSLVYETLIDGLSLIYYYDNDVFQHLKETKSLVNEYEGKLRRYLTELSCRELTEKDGNALASMLCSAVLLKQMTQMAVNIGGIGNDYKTSLSAGITETNLLSVADVVREVLRKTFGNGISPGQGDASLGKKIRQIKELRIDGENHCREQLQNGVYDAEDVMLYLSYAGQLERIAECCGELSSCISRSDFVLSDEDASETEEIFS